MRYLLSAVSAAVALTATAPCAGAAYDPPASHYSTSRLPPDPALKKAMPASHFRGFLRVSVDLSNMMPPVGDQGSLGSGVAWAIAYAARSYYAGEREGRDIHSPRNEASPGYVFNVASRGDCTDGASLSDTVDVLRKGALSLAVYPYDTSCSEPPRQLIATAKDFRVEGYRVLDRAEIDDIKGQIGRGNPVIAPFLVSPAFEAFRGRGIFDEKDFSQSGEDQWQALTIVGYDDHRQAVRVMNSWGRGWGDNGYAWISYPTLTARISAAIVLQTASSLLSPALFPPAAKPAVAIPKTPTTPPPPAPTPASSPAPTPAPTHAAAPPPVAPAPPPTAKTAVVLPNAPKLPPALPAPAPAARAPHTAGHEPHEAQANPNAIALAPQELAPSPMPKPAPQAQPQSAAPAAKLAPAAIEIAPPAAKKSSRPPRLADLGDLACGRIKQRHDGSKIILSGFVATAQDLAKVKAVVVAEQGQGKDYAFGEVKVAPWPLCEALDTLDKALADPIRPQLITTPADNAKAGELLRISLRAPARPSYLYLSYFEADQTVITLAQPEGLALRETPPHAELIFGDGRNGRAKFTVGPPFGTEMLVALASASPLFPNPLPQRQSEREYLSMLRKALIYKPVARLPDRIVGAAITILKTHSN